MLFKSRLFLKNEAEKTDERAGKPTKAHSINPLAKAAIVLKLSLPKGYRTSCPFGSRNKSRAPNLAVKQEIDAIDRRNRSFIYYWIGVGLLRVTKLA